MTKFAVRALAAVLIYGCVGGEASADQLFTYTISGAAFGDGSTLSGSFTLDVATQNVIQTVSLYSADLTTTFKAPSYTGFEYTYSSLGGGNSSETSSTLPPYTDLDDDPKFTLTSNAHPTYALTLDFSYAPPGSSATLYELLTNESEGANTRYLGSGATLAVTVPEPSSIFLGSSALALGLGVTRYRRPPAILA